MAREFSREVTFVLASQPTRGLDVGSIEYIHERIVQERDAGTAIVIVSTELDEIMAPFRSNPRDVFRGEIIAERDAAGDDHHRTRTLHGGGGMSDGGEGFREAEDRESESLAATGTGGGADGPVPGAKGSHGLAADNRGGGW